MHTLRQTVAVPLLAGVVAFSLLELCLFWLRDLTALYPVAMLDPPPYPAWSHVAQQILSAVQVVGPGMLGGWLAKRSGWAIGAAIGFVGPLAAWAVSASYVGLLGLEEYGASWALGVLAYSTITCAVGGMAGVALKVWSTPSNPRVESDAVAHLTRTR